MSTLTFMVQNGEEPLVRPEGTTVAWVVQISNLKPLVYRRIGKTTTSISGKSGETRIRGLVVSDTIIIPQIKLSELMLAIDFANSMAYGYGNPFHMDATDCFGIHRPFWGVVTEEITPLNNEGCKEWSLSIPFTEIPAP